MAYSNLVRFLIILIGGLLLGFIGFGLIVETGVQAEAIRSTLANLPKT